MSPEERLIELETKLTKREKDLSRLTADEQFALIGSRSREMVDPERLREQLRTSKKRNEPLRVKYGIDPTAKEAHLGHIVPIIVARRFLQMGHRVVIVLGDFTAFVGDPSGRVASRPVLTSEEIAENVVEYKIQIGRFIDTERVEFVYNSSFYDPKRLPLLEYLRILRKNSLAPLLQRDDLRQRKESGLSIAELLYPTLMAIDSIQLLAQVELGGVDQLLNFQITKGFMERNGLEPETAVTTDLLESTAGDGKKMSKSEGNFIPLTATPDDIYGKIMSIPDRLMEQYFKLLTDCTDEDWSGLSAAMKDEALSPKAVKQLLARVLVSWVHDERAAGRAEESFERIFSRRDVPDDIPSATFVFREGLSWIDLAVDLKLATSKSAFRRLMTSKSVRLKSPTEAILSDPDELVTPGEYVLRYGRGKFIRILLSV